MRAGDKARTRPPEPALACVVLAAGQGTRMRSAEVKVLHPVLGRPMVFFPIESARALGADPVVAVLGHQKVEVAAALDARYGAGAVRVVEQADQLGTGHALALALPALANHDGIVLVLYGDVPLLRHETLAELCGVARRHGCLAMVTSVLSDATGYGRVLRDRRGRVLRVVEEKDASEIERRVCEMNAGIYCAPAAFLRSATAALRVGNAQGEYYLTDVVASAARSIGVATVDAPPTDVGGINDRRQLAAAEALLRDRILRRFQEHATFHDPASVVVEPDAVVDVDARIGRGVALRGRTHVHHRAEVGDGAILTDTIVGTGAVILPYTVATQAVIGAGAHVGPFAHLRPGTVLADNVHVGNFVETKKTSMGRGSKANHLSYLGDATVGEKVNIGAGTITCNYDGYAKWPTVIEDGAFIGSDTQLVAPVRVGARAVVGAGTTVTEDVPPGALAISRVAQVNVPGYAEKAADRARRKAAARSDGADAGPPGTGARRAVDTKAPRPGSSRARRR